LIHSKDPARTTNGELIASAYYYHLLQIMKKFAGITNQPESEVLYYENLAQRIKLAFNTKFFNSKTNQYANNTVTANLLPLAFKMVSSQLEDKVFQNIVHEIEVTNKGHISTGVVGTQFLMRTLSAKGRSDLAYQLASNTTYPSWGYMIKNGATTIWELWNGNTADPKMNSQNHVMLLGDLLIWYYENIAGIKSSSKAVGFKEIIMNPDFVGGLSYVNASYESTYGVIKSNWKKNTKGLHWDITIPANTSAQVHLPTTVLSNIKFNNQLLEKGTPFTIEKNKLVLNLQSGTYSLDVRF
jgi:alpha-L-rhamnosidase